MDGPIVQDRVPGQQHAGGVDQAAYCADCGCSHYVRQSGERGWRPASCPNGMESEADETA